LDAWIRDEALLPPHTPTPEITRKVIDAYQEAILIHRRLTKGGRAGDFNEILVRLEINLFLEGTIKPGAWDLVHVACVRNVN